MAGGRWRIKCLTPPHTGHRRIARGVTRWEDRGGGKKMMVHLPKYDSSDIIDVGRKTHTWAHGIDTRDNHILTHRPTCAAETKGFWRRLTCRWDMIVQ